MKYTAENVLTLAKRFNNPKRSYLLVNPLQAKHIPVSPKKALDMMRTLGDKLLEKYPKTNVVIGFAETATAIGAAVAERFPDCLYIHTTREDLAGERVEFLEEHSHAAEQLLYTEKLRARLTDAEDIIFVDDELSTGKTLLNIARQLRTEFPELQNKRFTAASIISRLSPENEALLGENSIVTECLVRLPLEDLTEKAAGFDISEAEPLHTNLPRVDYKEIKIPRIHDPRTGVVMRDYIESCQSAAEKTAPLLPKGGSVLVLGTEEFMYPALVLGSMLENEQTEVLCHATTRSPIGVLDSENYPIKNGYKLHSFYGDRGTYIYNLRQYDAAVIMTDGGNESAISETAYLLKKYGCEKIFYLRY